MAEKKRTAEELAQYEIVGVNAPISLERLARFGDTGGPDAFLRFDPDYKPTATPVKKSSKTAKKA